MARTPPCAQRPKSQAAGPGTARQAGVGPTVPQGRGTFPSERGRPRSWEPSPSRAGGCKPSSRYYGCGGSPTQACGKYFTAPVCDNAALTDAVTGKRTSAAVKSCEYGDHGKSSRGRGEGPQGAGTAGGLELPPPPGRVCREQGRHLQGEVHSRVGTTGGRGDSRGRAAASLRVDTRHRTRTPTPLGSHT